MKYVKLFEQFINEASTKETGIPSDLYSEFEKFDFSPKAAGKGVSTKPVGFKELTYQDLVDNNLLLAGNTIGRILRDYGLFKPKGWDPDNSSFPGRVSQNIGSYLQLVVELDRKKMRLQIKLVNNAPSEPVSFDPFAEAEYYATEEQDLLDALRNILEYNKGLFKLAAKSKLKNYK